MLNISIGILCTFLSWTSVAFRLMGAGINLSTSLTEICFNAVVLKLLERFTPSVNLCGEWTRAPFPWQRNEATFRLNLGAASVSQSLCRAPNSF